MALANVPRSPSLRRMKPLFIPLCGRWFDAFASGRKSIEYRRPKGAWSAKHIPMPTRLPLSASSLSRDQRTASPVCGGGRKPQAAETGAAEACLGSLLKV